uniref:ATP synthase complex subunit 8 n=1 Tax=Athalia tanaoserrula TaxID=2813725 RepID=A0A977XSZ4_9HYME|nr:ATP synthase F0 subunit 8 [Athalia tanaoserrula]UXW93571.1 ATP synthase F0 subunit 8 [Athalia tanaoserrula]
MPQMFPMNWLMQFFFFSVMFFILFILNYFIFSPNLKLKSMNKVCFLNNSWKW